MWKKQLLSISVWHLTTWDVQQTSQPNEMKATAGVFANFTLRETNTMHLWKRKVFSQYWKGLCFFRWYRGTMSIFKLSFCVYEGQNYILSFSCFRTVVKKSSLLRETSCHASLYPAHIQYHPIKCKVQQHFKSYVKLHVIFHQAFWMATLLMDSSNSLTSLLEQKRALKKIQAAASVSPCSMTVWPALEL